ncbi:hypothetical protein VNO80_15632 [Phaseolus coccineus]|uniref:Non-haem dioxygenase N-terminal domain-containing protein n=1 Tax=Phaseolus coccineus TaxID=3886 RepID=A0AAN9MQM6_PHACN
MDSSYDRKAEIKVFEETKSGVKGSDSKVSVPIINLESIHNNPALHKEAITKIRSACQECGFFQVINHGISIPVIDDMINGIRRFCEQDANAKLTNACVPYFGGFDSDLLMVSWNSTRMILESEDGTRLPQNYLNGGSRSFSKRKGYNRVQKVLEEREASTRERIISGFEKLLRKEKLQHVEGLL